MPAKPLTLDEQMKKSEKGLKAYFAGTGRLRTWLLSPTGERTLLYETLPEAKARRQRLEKWKTLRAQLGFTQARLAAALRVPLNTLKGWEAGKPIPEVAFTLAEVLHDFPAVRKKLAGPPPR